MSRGDAQETFGRIYATDHWEGGSGVGSAPDATVPYRAGLAHILGARDVRSVLDVGCGDWQLGSLVNWTGVTYLGMDVVPEVIESNRRRYGGRRVSFDVADARGDCLPVADLLLAKDVLQHWPTTEVQAFLSRHLTRYRYVLLTNDIASVHWSGEVNADIELGAWRTLDLEAEPFLQRAVWRQDFDVRGEWTKRSLLYATRRARHQRWVPGNALARLRKARLSA